MFFFCTTVTETLPRVTKLIIQQPGIEPRPCDRCHSQITVHVLTVRLLDADVIGLRVADGDLLLGPALPEDQTLLTDTAGLAGLVRGVVPQ